LSALLARRVDAMKKFVYDSDSNSFIHLKSKVGDIVLSILKYIGLSILMALVCYIIFALFFDTDVERNLSMENKELRKQYEMLREKANMVEGVIEDLEIRDRSIYNDVFKSDPPTFGSSSLDSTIFDITDLYDMHESDILWDSYAYGRKLESSVERVSDWLANISQNLEKKKEAPTTIPSIIPIKNFTIIQTGASIGSKVNPFYKIIREHTGIDLMAPIGTDVICSADGVVQSVTKSQGGFGNKINVEHSDGIVSSYSHLSDILVRQGQKVEQGMVIGRVGASGTCFAPCLHYEIIRDGEYQEPVYYFFADLTPDSFKEMLIVATTTGQSMD